MRYFSAKDRRPVTFEFFNNEYGRATVEIDKDLNIVHVEISQLGVNWKRRMVSPVLASYNGALLYIETAINDRYKEQVSK